MHGITPVARWLEREDAGDERTTEYRYRAVNFTDNGAAPPHRTCFPCLRHERKRTAAPRVEDSQRSFVDCGALVDDPQYDLRSNLFDGSFFGVFEGCAFMEGTFSRLNLVPFEEGVSYMEGVTV